MKNKLFSLIPCLFAGVVPAANIDITHQLSHISTPTIEKEAQVAFQYFLDEVEKDAILSHEEQHKKVQEFKTFADGLSPEVALLVTNLLLQETRSRIIDIFNKAGLEELEINEYLADYEVVRRSEKMNVEFARQMLFFVAELKLHRQYVYEFGVALGCPEKQLLRHDLCKLHKEQFEGYARYFRGGRQEVDKLAYLAAWEEHQYEEHHHEAYTKEGFDFEKITDERLRNNMLEAVADLLAATKQRGGGTLIGWLVNVFPKKNPHPRLIPYLEEALKKAHAFYLESEKNPDAESIFKGFPCWNSDVEKAFGSLKATS